MVPFPEPKNTGGLNESVLIHEQKRLPNLCAGLKTAPIWTASGSGCPQIHSQPFHCSVLDHGEAYPQLYSLSSYVSWLWLGLANRRLAVDKRMRREKPGYSLLPLPWVATPAFSSGCISSMAPVPGLLWLQLPAGVLNPWVQVTSLRPLTLQPRSGSGFLL